MTDTIVFVDPRLHSEPPARVSREPAAHGEELRDLIQLCQAGRVYEVERWIQEGRSIQAVNYKTPKKRVVETPLQAAVRTKHRDLVLLLLCNGYRLDLEPNGSDSVVNQALGTRAFDLLELLLKWGADPESVDLETLFDTYKSELFTRFQDFGIDLTKGHALARALAYHTSNRPLFGFAKRHRESNPKMQTELNIALGHHVSEGSEKGVQLCLWAGADPHVPAVSLRFWRESANEDDDETEFGLSAMYEACMRGDVEILRRLGPDPTRDDFDELYRAASNRSVIDLLAKMAPPKTVAAVIQHHLWWATFNRDRWTSIDTLQRIFENGGRWTEATVDEIADLRRCLLKASNSVFVEVMKLLATRDYCSLPVLKELGRTPSMLARMKEVGFVPLPKDDPKRYTQLQPTRSREVLKKFGVELPKERNAPLAPIPESVRVGRWRPNGREVRMDRGALFDRVWSQPVAKLAAEWGISGPGLKKVCRRLQIPVPPRGHWAKLKAGHRTSRPRLPGLPTSSVPEIVFRVP